MSLDVRGGAGVRMQDEIGPFLEMMAKRFPKQSARTINNGLYFLQQNAKQDLKKNKAGNVKLEPTQELRRRKGDYTRYLKDKKKGMTRNQKNALKIANSRRSGQYAGIASQRKVEKKQAKKLHKGLANAIRYSKYKGSAGKPAVGWVFRNGSDQKVWGERGVYYQTGGSQIVTPRMRRYFAAARGTAYIASRIPFICC